MIIRTTIAVLAVILAAAILPPPAAARFNLDYGVTFQERLLSSGGRHYEARQLQLFLQPRIRLGRGWRAFLRLGYSNLSYDRPDREGRSYSRWGFSWGTGLGWTPLRWSGFYLDGEAAFFQTRTSSSSTVGEYFNWGSDLRVGWDPGPADVYLGAAYDDGVVRDRSRGDSSRNDYRLRDPWNLFAGARLNLPVLPKLEARYYFWKDRLAVLGFTYQF